MINTLSKFYYGLTITDQNKYIDFDEGAGALVADIATGTYTPEDLADAVQAALTTAGTLTYTVSFNRTTRILTITSSAQVDWLAATGTNAALGLGAYTVLGYPATDVLNVTTFSGSTAIASVYLPQYKLQDYVDQEHNRMNRFQTVSKSASGKVEMQSFGIDRFFEFSIKFATDIYQPVGGPILNNQNGVDNLQAFMVWLADKNNVEFMPDRDVPGTYFRVVLESAPGAGDGSGFKLLEQYGRGLTGYFETGILKFRIIED
jgi:hypothetical protein